MEFNALVQQPESLRDSRWEAEFLSAFTGLKVRLDSDQPKTGPDGWPYLLARTGPEAEEPVLKIMPWLAGRGVGLVVNAHKMLPDYVFPYGMIWHFVETGRFLEPAVTGRAGEVVYRQDKNLVVGPPSEKYLPPYVRAVLREFLMAQGFATPKVLVVSSADFKEVDLVFSVESLNNLPRSQHPTLAEMLAWFLPLHYTLVLGPEKDFPAFHAL